jgi:hypothetical protein
MANVEQFIKDSGSGNWRPMTSSDLATVKNNGTATVTPAGKSFSMQNGSGDLTSASSILYAINVSFKGVTAGDTIMVRDGGTNIARFIAESANCTYNFTPSAGITCANKINCVLTLTGSSPSGFVGIVYENS